MKVQRMCKKLVLLLLLAALLCQTALAVDAAKQAATLWNIGKVVSSHPGE